MVLQVEGEREFQMGDRHYSVERGRKHLWDSLPPHTRLKVSKWRGKMLAITQPAGRPEDFLVEFGF
jgi:hypothetical protein